MKFDSVVEVKAVIFPKGVLTHFEYVENFVLREGEWEEVSEEHKPPEDKSIISCDYDTKITQEVVGFQFSIVGESNDDLYSSGLDFELEHMSKRDIFEEFLEEFEKIARKRIENLKPKSNKLIDVFSDYGKKKGNEPTTVRFLTLWNYESDHGLGGECGSDWEYLGLLRDALMKKGDSV